HSSRDLLDDRADLLPVDRLGHHGVRVADQPGDVLDRDTVLGQQRDEAVPQRPAGPSSLLRDPWHRLWNDVPSGRGATCKKVIMVLISGSRIRDGLARVQEGGATFIEAALDREVARKVALEASRGTFERLAEREGTARQDGEYFMLAGDMDSYPLIEHLCRELKTVINEQGSHITGL